jgi:hypothetical protein
MGKAIVYCQDCGLSLHEDDFERGKASRIDNRPYCVKCRPVQPPTPRPLPPPPTSSRRISDRVPMVRPPATPRSFKAPAPRSPLVVWLSLGFIAVVIVVGLTLALAGGKPSEPAPTVVEPTPRPKPPDPPVDQDLELLTTQLSLPPERWKRDEIEAALQRRPDLERFRKDYARGVLALGLREGLIGHWALDEKDGTVARDASGLGHDGKILGGPLRVPGKAGGAFQFRGNGEDGVEIPSAGALDLFNAKTFSLCAWIRPDDVPPGQENSANDAWYGILVRNGMHMGLCYTRAGRGEMTYWLEGPKNATQSSADTIPPRVWTHLAGVVDSSEGRTRVYVNGRLSGEASWAARSKVHPVAKSSWRIGIGAPKAKEYAWSMRGTIDDVRFYARALDVEEIALLAAGTSPPAGAPPGRAPSSDGLVLHLRADAGVEAVDGLVSAWSDVERKLVARAEGEQRPALKEGAIVFDGKKNRLALAAAPELSFKATDSFTLRAAVRVDAVVKGRYAGLVAKSSDKPPWYGIWTDSDGRWVFGSHLNLHGSAAKPGLATVTAVQVGGKERRLHVDGVRVATGPIAEASGPGDLWIGGVNTRGEHFPGAILEIKLWRRALDPLEIAK